jgi:hypothetical protein
MDFVAFAKAPPKFHFWNGTWNEGGFSTYLLQELYNFCRKHGPPSPTVLERAASCLSMILSCIRSRN